VDGAVGHRGIIAELTIGHSGLYPAILSATTLHAALGCRRLQRCSKMAAALDQSTRAPSLLTTSGRSDAAERDQRSALSPSVLTIFAPAADSRAPASTTTIGTPAQSRAQSAHGPKVVPREPLPVCDTYRKGNRCPA
jgi:hypothetical protein